MKYYLIAGEASGDLHGANLIKALKTKDPQAEFRVWGGDFMAQAGSLLVKHYKTLAFMGFVEVLLNLRTIFKNLSFCKRDILEYNPDALIFIDYPGFNLRIAKWAKTQGFFTHYYISPQLWAWKENRIKAIKRDIDALYCILPFEKDFYEKKHGYKIHFVGHPLLDAIAQTPKQHKLDVPLNNKPIVAILPGSRKQEIKKMLPLMAAMAHSFSDYQFIVAGAPSQPPAFYKTLLKGTSVKIVFGQTYTLLQHAHAALVTSGTATLETALFKVPQVVCYKGNWISYQIAKRVINLSYISLVNLILNKLAVVELIQNKLSKASLKEALTAILNPQNRTLILKDYKQLETMLGGAGASMRVANLIFEKATKKQ